ncbi:uncharacterized protein [Atheta coriaria]|uniref:uncharacterized protein isoform X2 n=1 Tax=Dalotia coriaria TaxID=877792 RepID=UPI0031F33C6C
MIIYHQIKHERRETVHSSKKTKIDASASDSKSSPSSVKVEAKSKQIMTNKTPAMLLQELSTQRCGHGPTYDLITLQQGTHENLLNTLFTFWISLQQDEDDQKEAKQETAKNALLLLQDYLKVIVNHSLPKHHNSYHLMMKVNYQKSSTILEN